MFMFGFFLSWWTPDREFLYSDFYDFKSSQEEEDALSKGALAHAFMLD